MPQHNYPNGKPWSDSDIAFLRRLAGVMTLRDIASELHRTHAAVRTMSTRLSLNLRDSYTRWSSVELQILRSCAGTMNATQIAEKLGRTLDSVKGKASLLGLSLLCIGERHHHAVYSDHDVSLCVALHEEGLSSLKKWRYQPIAFMRLSMAGGLPMMTLHGETYHKRKSPHDRLHRQQHASGSARPLANSTSPLRFP